MDDLFASGRVIDLIVALMVLEGIGLTILHRATGRGVPLAALGANLLAGGALMLALRAALVGSGWMTVAMFLAAGLVAHVVDLGQRWK